MSTELLCHLFISSLKISLTPACLWAFNDLDGQEGLACCDSWGHKESDMTEWLNWTELNWIELNKLDSVLVPRSMERNEYLCLKAAYSLLNLERQ